MGVRWWHLFLLLLLLHLHVAMAQRESDCEGRGFSKSECKAVSFCGWERGQCWYQGPGYSGMEEDEKDVRELGESDDIDWTGMIFPAFGAFFSLMGLMPIVSTCRAKRTNDFILRQGVDTEAVVQGKEEHESIIQGGDFHALHLIFDADRSKDGVRCRITRERTRVSFDMYNKTLPGDAVTVRYSPTDPRHFWVKGEEPDIETACSVCFNTVFSSFFVLFGAVVGVGMPIITELKIYLGVLVYRGSMGLVYGCCTKSGRMCGQCLCSGSFCRHHRLFFCSDEIEQEEHPTGSIPKPRVEVVQGTAAPEQAATTSSCTNAEETADTNAAPTKALMHSGRAAPPASSGTGRITEGPINNNI
jgi:hypothetical protein